MGEWDLMTPRAQCLHCRAVIYLDVCRALCRALECRTVKYSEVQGGEGQGGEGQLWRAMGYESSAFGVSTLIWTSCSDKATGRWVERFKRRTSDGNTRTAERHMDSEDKAQTQPRSNTTQQATICRRFCGRIVLEGARSVGGVFRAFSMDWRWYTEVQPQWGTELNCSGSRGYGQMQIDSKGVRNGTVLRAYPPVPPAFFGASAGCSWDVRLERSPVFLYAMW